MNTNNGTLLTRKNSGRPKRSIECSDARVETETCIRLSKGMEWLVDRLGNFPRGANILLSGDPGVGKSTLSLQIAAAAASAGEKTLYLATEQTSESVRNRLDQLCNMKRAIRNLTIKDDLYDLSLLPQLLCHQLLRPGSALFGTRLVVVDSLQGCGGISPQDKRAWGAILDYLRQAGGAGITTIALAHMTKGRAIAGPRTLEHACDATILLRYGASCRALIIPKNRFGPAQIEPVGLNINSETTRLEPSPLGAAATARIKTVALGGIIEIEVAITPVRNDRGFIKSPGLCGKEIETTVDLVERTFPEARFLWAMGVTVRAPDGVKHRRDCNLAVAMALLAALRQATITENLLFIGDISLEGEVRPPSAHTIASLEDAQAAGSMIDIDGIVTSNADHQEAYDDLGLPIHQVNSVLNLLQYVEVCHG